VKFKILLVFSFVVFSVSGMSHAGFLGLTMFSRANCVSFNESVSWDASRQWVMDVASWQSHEDGRSRYFEDFQSVWWDVIGPPRNRAYAGCNLCGISGWEVYGYHYLLDTEYPEGPFFLADACPLPVTPGWTDQMVICKTTHETSCNLTEW